MCRYQPTRLHHINSKGHIQHESSPPRKPEDLYPKVYSSETITSIYETAPCHIRRPLWGVNLSTTDAVCMTGGIPDCISETVRTGQVDAGSVAQNPQCSQISFLSVNCQFARVWMGRRPLLTHDEQTPYVSAYRGNRLPIPCNGTEQTFISVWQSTEQTSASTDSMKTEHWKFSFIN